MPSSLLDRLSTDSRRAPESGIVEVFDYGRGRPGLIPMWSGEGDLPTPPFIYEAATRALAAGETYYTYQRGIPDLRAAIARYMERTHGRPVSPDRFYVTCSGMQALQIAFTMVTAAGDEVIVPTPAWPNAAAAVGVRGAVPVSVPMTLGNQGWTLDIDQLAAAITPRTKAMFINSPCNPTGWTATREELAAILAVARAKGVWIIADEIYSRFYYSGSGVAPSFRDVAEPDDAILFVNTMSKNWAMTGWRVGWLETPAALGQVAENLIQYSTSGVAQFMQKAALVALDQGDAFIAHQVDRARRSRDIVCDALAATGQVRFARPDGAFYLFFAIEGETDTRPLALRLVDEANIGLAPGTAFGLGGAPYLRMCFAKSPEAMTEATNRLVTWLKSR